MAKTVKRLSYLFLVLGFAAVGGAIFWSIRTQAFIARAVIAAGKVVSLDRSWSKDSYTFYPIVAFKTKSGQEMTFRSSSGSNPPSYQVGEPVEVLYDEAAPNDASIRGFFALWGGPVILGGLGGLFSLIGGGMVFVPMLSRRRADELRQHGMAVQTEFQSIEQNTSLTVNGCSPWRIVSQWKDPTSGTLHLFHSENIWFDPTAHMTSRQLTVYIDRANPKRYAMDTSFLPKLAE